VLVKVRIVGYLRAGGVVFNLCGCRCMVFYCCWVPCAGWPAYLWSGTWSLDMRLCGCVCFSVLLLISYAVASLFFMLVSM